MDDNRAQQSGTSPPKPWEGSGPSSGPAPFKPPSSGTTSDIVEASGTARPGEIVTPPDANTAAANRNALGRSLPSRPWEQQQTYNNSYMGTSPPKPWEGSGPSSGPAPFKPPSSGTTSDIVEASGTARPGEIVTPPDANTAAANRNALGRSLPSRPWEQQQTYNNSYMGAGYGSTLNNNSGYGSETYGSYGGMYGNSMYRGGMNGGAGGLYGGGMYGGGMYNSSFGGAMGGYGGMGMGMGGPPYGDQDPNNPFAAPSSPPGFWVSFMHVMQGVVTFFGRVAMLIDQNTQAFHMFMSALLQLFDRSGMLYGELARFVFRLLGIRTKSQKAQPPHPNGLPGPHNFPGSQNHIEGPKVAPSNAWDGVWGKTK